MLGYVEDIRGQRSVIHGPGEGEILRAIVRSCTRVDHIMACASISGIIARVIAKHPRLSYVPVKVIDDAID